MSRSITTDALRDYAEMLKAEGRMMEAGTVLNAIKYCCKQEPGLSEYAILHYPDLKEVHVLDLSTTGDQLLDEDLEEGFVDYIDYTVESIGSDDTDAGIYMTKFSITERFKTDEDAAKYYESCRREEGELDEYYRIISEKEYEKLMGHTLDERDY